MPQANDAELTELYTSETGVDVENNEPNAGGIRATYDLHLQAVAGNTIGDGAGDYTLRIDCIDETLAQPADPQMSVAPVTQTFEDPPWVAANDNFVTDQTFPITVPANVEGHVFRYVASMVSAGEDVVSFLESNQFILLDP